MRSSLFPRIDAKNIDREVHPKRSSFSGKMEVAKLSCSSFSGKMEVAKLSCALNFQVRVVS